MCDHVILPNVPVYLVRLINYVYIGCGQWRVKGVVSLHKKNYNFIVVATVVIKSETSIK